MRSYSRQLIFDQDKLSNTKIAIVGAGALSNYLCLYLSGLGIKNICLVDDSPHKSDINEFLLRGFQDQKVYGLEKKVKEINPEIKIFAINSTLTDYLIGQPEVLIDLTNNPESKKKCKSISKNIKSLKKVISASTSENNGSIRVYNPTRAGPLILKKKSNVLVLKKEDFSLGMYQNFTQGSFTSGLMAAIVLDEIRKSVLPLENEHPLKGKVDFSLYSKKRFNDSLRFDEKSENLSNLNVLVVGAGGIGTYVCLNLALMGVGNIDLYDGDIIEDHNLNRQVFYYDAIGKNKAEVLAGRLNKLNKSCITPHSVYLKDVSKLKKYDAIFSCLDNWEHRFILSDYAVKNKIPFINGAVTTFKAYADFYTCLSCKHNVKNLLENEKYQGAAGCVDVANSNVVMSNAFVGALMASEAKSIAFPEKYRPLYKKEVVYNSQSVDALRFVVSDPVMNCLCHKKDKGCDCHENYN